MSKWLRLLVQRGLGSAGYRLSRIPRSAQVPPGVLAVQGVDAYGTHYIPLAAAVARTTGPVLELGMGDHSTLLLHLMCHDRLVVSADSSADWVERYGAFRSATHQLHAVSDWRTWPVIEAHRWDVAFVDCSPPTERLELIERLRTRARFIVVHDTDPDTEAALVYAFENALHRFRYRSDYRVLRPFTTVVSDVEAFTMTAAEQTPRSR